MKNHAATSSKLYRSYYPHRSRELVSPVCGIFAILTRFQQSLTPYSAHLALSGGTLPPEDRRPPQPGCCEGPSTCITYVFTLYQNTL